jgi:hypothetical protein
MAGTSGTGGQGGSAAGASGAAGNGGTGGATAGAAGAAGSGGIGGGTAGGAGKGGAGGASAGGSAGSGGIGGSGGNGGSAGGGNTLPCLPATAYQSLITVDAAFPLCVVRVHSTNQAVANAAATWGMHGGPLSSVATGKQVTVTRWTLPKASTDAAVGASVTFMPDGLPATDIFWGGVVDLPFQGWTLFSYTGTGMGFPGEVILTDHDVTKVLSRGATDGYFSGVGIASGGNERLVYSGLSPIAATAPATTANALYGAAPCGGQIVASGACSPAAALDTWQSSSGPVAADSLGNVFAVMSTFGGMEEPRGYLSSALLTGATTGASFPKDGAFTTSFAAVSPAKGADGILLIQESDATSFAPLDLIAYGYTTSTAVVPTGPLGKAGAIKAVSGAGLSLFADDAGGLWLAIDTGAGAGALVGLQRK